MNRNELKNHSLENLSAWVVDCIESDASADEIYDTIVETIRQQNLYHKSCFNNGERLIKKFPASDQISNVTSMHNFQQVVSQFWEDKDITGEDC